MAKGAFTAFGKGEAGAAREYLANVAELKGAFRKPLGKLSDTYVTRVANDIARAVAHGATPSLQVARGHARTPERKGAAVPKHTPSETSHRMPVARQVKYSSGATDRVTRSEKVAMRTVNFYADVNPYQRIGIRFYDSRNGRWYNVYHNVGHGKLGISAGYLKERIEQAGGLAEAVAMDWSSYTGFSFDPRDIGAYEIVEW